jgi:hypothetical protein
VVKLTGTGFINADAARAVLDIGPLALEQRLAQD